MNKERDISLMLFTVLMLAFLGIIMVYSSSFILAQQRYGDGFYFLKKQLLFCAIGLAVMLIAMRLPVNVWKHLALPLFIASLAGLAMVLFSPWAIKVSGARRWIGFAGWSMQPSEIAKIALVLLLAKHFSKTKYLVAIKKAPSFKRIIVPLLATSVVTLLVLCQPDFGTGISILFLAAVVLFVVGVKLRYLLAGMLLSLPFFYHLILNVDYRRRRWLAFLDPWSDQADSGFQIIQSYVAFQEGGLWGSGLGSGKQKLFFLPEAHTDFILSVIGEEIGLLGVLLVISLFYILFWKGIQAVLKSDDAFSQYLAAGLTLLVATQAIFNMGVVMGILPTKGLPMPFISYGGTSLLVSFLACGILMSIAKRCPT